MSWEWSWSYIRIRETHGPFDGFDEHFLKAGIVPILLDVTERGVVYAPFSIHLGPGNGEIAVLPVSTFDDELRFKIARSIYGHSNFWNYAIMPNPPIHIVVEHGRVTLTGVVNSDVDRMLARSLASQFNAFSVTNDLKTDAEVKEAWENVGKSQ